MTATSIAEFRDYAALKIRLTPEPWIIERKQHAAAQQAIEAVSKRLV